LTIDEDLSMLEDQVRRLKVEYDIYFGGGSKKPPTEIEWKVKTLLKKYSDGGRMSYGQRFRYTTVQQRYALFNALWQQKLIIKEEGYRRPQDAVLGIQGMRPEQQHEAERSLSHSMPVLPPATLLQALALRALVKTSLSGSRLPTPSRKAKMWNRFTTLWSQPRSKPVTRMQPPWIPSRNSCSRRRLNSRKNTAAKLWNTPSRCKTARSS